MVEFVQRREKQGPSDDCWFIQESTTTQKFLLVHQTAHQKRMLELYGKVIVGLDATYKTSKWGFPLFLMNVVNNHGKGIPVALFFVQQETTEMVTLALKKYVFCNPHAFTSAVNYPTLYFCRLREWNPSWKPKHVMVDKSEVEIGAIEDAFDGEVSPLLCDFHRLQAQWRWIVKSDNKVPVAR